MIELTGEHETVDEMAQKVGALFAAPPAQLELYACRWPPNPLVLLPLLPEGTPKAQPLDGRLTVAYPSLDRFDEERLEAAALALEGSKFQFRPSPDPRAMPREAAFMRLLQVRTATTRPARGARRSRSRSTPRPATRAARSRGRRRSGERSGSKASSTGVERNP